MSAYALPEISQLHHQLTLSPSRLRLKQVRGIEHALTSIEKGQSYPYELICFWITGFRLLRSDNGAAFEGAKLAGDLVRLADDLSKKASIKPEDLGESFATQEDLAGRFNVSLKTVSRWRRRGLGGFRVQMPDGQKKVVFGESVVRRFEVDHRELIRKAAAFTQLSAKEKGGIIERARELLAEERLKLHEVSQRIAAETNRAVETVRYTLRRHDRESPEQAVFENNGKPRVHPDHRAIYARYQDGLSTERIAEQVGRSARAVKQIILEMRAREVLERPIDFMPNDSFQSADADERILGAPIDLEPVCDPKQRPSGGADSSPYLENLYEQKLLNRAQERALFCRYNYVKFKAARLRETLDAVDVDEKLLDEIESLLQHADELRNHLIKCNLRLVVSIAKRHVGIGEPFFSAISDGNLSLMRAVEKFDFARGNKFSTYATWAIMKTYARTIPEQRYHLRRFMTGQDEMLLGAPDPSAMVGPLSHLHSVKEAIGKGWKVLTSREQNVLKRHFGLYGQRQPQTLEQIGRAIGISKERVRQIEKQAIKKLGVELAPIRSDLME